MSAQQQAWVESEGPLVRAFLESLTGEGPHFKRGAILQVPLKDVVAALRRVGAAPPDAEQFFGAKIEGNNLLIKVLSEQYEPVGEGDCYPVLPVTVR